MKQDSPVPCKSRHLGYVRKPSEATERADLLSPLLRSHASPFVLLHLEHGDQMIYCGPPMITRVYRVSPKWCFVRTLRHSSWLASSPVKAACMLLRAAVETVFLPTIVEHLFCLNVLSTLQIFLF